MHATNVSGINLFLRVTMSTLYVQLIHKVPLFNLYQAKGPETSYHYKSNQRNYNHTPHGCQIKKSNDKAIFLVLRKTLFTKCILNLPNTVQIKTGSTLCLLAQKLFSGPNITHCVVPEDIFTPTG